MRISLISYRLPVSGQKRGGVDRVAHDLADGLARRGHLVKVWSYDPKPTDAAYEVQMLPWKKFVDTKLGFRITGGYIGNIVNLLPQYDGDLLIANGDSLLMPLLRKPLIRIMHGSALGEAFSSTSPLRWALQLGIWPQELLAALLQPGCVGVSHNCRRYNPFIHNIIPLGVDLAAFTPALENKTRCPSILFVGNLTGRKRGSFLLSQFKDFVRPRFPDAQLMMVSEPGAPEDGVSYFTGISQQELTGLFQKAWVYASPSKYEGFGLPYLEAMACGTPVVTTPNPGSRELLGDSQFGSLASDANFGRKLCDLLSNKSLRDKLIVEGLRRASEYSLDKMLDRFELLMQEICAGSLPVKEPA